MKPAGALIIVTAANIRDALEKGSDQDDFVSEHGPNIICA